MDEIKTILTAKFEEIRSRITRVLEQLNDEDVNWRTNESSNSIANLIVHMNGNIHDRISKGIHNRDFTRDRDGEFEQMFRTQAELLQLTNASLQELIQTTKSISNETLRKTQWVRDIEKTNLEVLIQAATHFSEHMGQIFYIAKLIKDDEYQTTSVPKKRN